VAIQAATTMAAYGVERKESLVVDRHQQNAEIFLQWYK